MVLSMYSNYHVLNLGYIHVWLGLTDVVDEDQYVYSSTGYKSRYLNWDKGQPNGGTGENCAALPMKGRKWHDYSCDRKCFYVSKNSAKHFL